MKPFKRGIIAAGAFLLLAVSLQVASMVVFTVDITSKHWQTLNGLVWMALLLAPASLLVGMLWTAVKEEW